MAGTDTTRQDRVHATPTRVGSGTAPVGGPAGGRRAPAPLPISGPTAARSSTANDSLRVVRPLLTATRWGTLAVGLAVAASGDRSARALASGVALAVYALIRTFWPLSSRNKVRGLLGVLGEV